MYRIVILLFVSGGWFFFGSSIGYTQPMDNLPGVDSISINQNSNDFSENNTEAGDENNGESSEEVTAEEDEEKPLLTEEEKQHLYEEANKEKELLETIHIEFDPSWDNESESFFQQALIVNPAAPKIPYSETPFKRFHVIFFASMPLAYLFNNTIFDLYTQQVPRPFIEEHEQFRPNVHSTAMARFIMIATLIISAGIAWDDYLNVFTYHLEPIHPADRMIWEEEQEAKKAASADALIFPMYSVRF